TGAHFRQDHFLARLRADQNPDLASDDEINVGRFVLIIDDDFAFIVPPPGAAAIETIEVQIRQIFKKWNAGKRLHYLGPRRRPKRPAPSLVRVDFGDRSIT